MIIPCPLFDFGESVCTMSVQTLVIQYLITAIITLGPIVALIVARRKIGVLNAASWLVVWGSIFVIAEHTSFTIQGTLESAVSSHLKFHMYMSAAYTAVGVLVLSIIAQTVLKRGQSPGWYALFAALLIGGGIDLILVTTVFPHGAPPPRSIPPGIALYTYHLAWLAALIISYKPIFGNASERVLPN